MGIQMSDLESNAFNAALANNILNLAIQCDEWANVLFSKVAVTDFDVKLDRDIFKTCRVFYDTHKQTPGVNQLLDIFQKRIADTPEIVELIRQFQNNAVKVPKAVIDSLDDWKLSQTLQTKALSAIKDIRAGASNPKDLMLKLSKELRDEVLKTTAKASFMSTSDLAVFDEVYNDDVTEGEFFWGIPPLDMFSELRVDRTQTHLVLMHPKVGKTSILELIARTNAEMGKKVLFVTLENSQKKIYDRLTRGWYGVGKDQAVLPSIRPVFNRGGDGNTTTAQIQFIETQHTRHMKDPAVRADVRMQIEAMRDLQEIHIAHFPRYTMTLDMYYEVLLRDDYDVVCLDYAAIAHSKHVSANERSKELELFVGTICGFASELDFAQFTVHQAHDQYNEVMWLNNSHASESKSLDRPLDGYWSVSSTPEEIRRNLLRMQCVTHRHTELRPRFLIARNLAVQNFCQDWAWLPDWNGYNLEYLTAGDDND
jgi:replicative DNA helicase